MDFPLVKLGQLITTRITLFFAQVDEFELKLDDTKIILKVLVET